MSVPVPCLQQQQQRQLGVGCLVQPFSPHAATTTRTAAAVLNAVRAAQCSAAASELKVKVLL
jgi:hypothetical protein